jgi:hypothetical protein
VDLTPPPVPNTPLYKPGGSINDYIQQTQNAQNAANNANQTRYNQGLNVLTTGMDSARNSIQSALSDSNGLGTAARTRIGYNLQNAQGHSQQSAIDRGLYNTTILDSLQRGNARDAEDANQAVDEQTANRRININLANAQNERSGAGDISKFISDRNDAGPDMSLYTQLLKDAASNPGNTHRDSTTITPAPPPMPPPAATSPGGGAGAGGGSNYYSGNMLGSTAGGGGGSSGSSAGSYYGNAGLGTQYGGTISNAIGGNVNTMPSGLTPGAYGGGSIAPSLLGSSLLGTPSAPTDDLTVDPNVPLEQPRPKTAMTFEQWLASPAGVGYNNTTSLQSGFAYKQYAGQMGL